MHRHTVLYHLHAMTDGLLPLDQAVHKALATAMLDLDVDALHPGDYAQIVLQLTGHAFAVAAALRTRCAGRARADGGRVRVEAAVGDVLGTLAKPVPGTLDGAKNCARAVIALHTCAEHLDNAPGGPRPLPGPGPHGRSG
ncbi:restriction endonuclease [Streptomyces sp. NPDC051567]|uniref:restriction endonuclease n=1 Tax=Streptomyces sp. NPDC051567 TaxID=3365660 RepID=UPI0037AA10E2